MTRVDAGNAREVRCGVWFIQHVINVAIVWGIARDLHIGEPIPPYKKANLPNQFSTPLTTSIAGNQIFDCSCTSLLAVSHMHSRCSTAVIFLYEEPRHPIPTRSSQALPRKIGRVTDICLPRLCGKAGEWVMPMELCSMPTLSDDASLSLSIPELLGAPANPVLSTPHAQHLYCDPLHPPEHDSQAWGIFSLVN